jgi:integrase/recombinase XerD
MTAWGLLKPIAAAVGVPALSPHWLRHAHATSALDNGADLVNVSRTLRHKSVQTTMIYLHSRPDDSSAMFIPKLNRERGKD